MRRLCALLAAVTAVVLSLLVGAGAARAADVVDDAITALRSDHLFVAPGVDNQIDQATVRRAIGDDPTWLAVLPESAGSPVQLSLRIGQALGNGTVGVVAGRDFEASSNVLCPGQVQSLVSRTKSDNRDELTKTNNVTKLLSDFAADVITADRRGRDCDAAGGAQTSAPADEGSSAWPWVVGIGAVGVAGAAGGGMYVRSQRRKRREAMAGRRAEVLSLYDRLGHDVSNLDPGDDDVARQALGDASERYTATGSLLQHADSDGEYDAAKRTALEGLYAARTARTALGLDPGPELPSVAPATGQQLTEEQEVAVGDKSYRGYPSYTPGAPYYYGGGGGVPGGWYAFPFWETLLLGSVLSGGFGGWGGGGYGAGYDQGFDAGRDSVDGGGDGGAGWDSSGGGWDSSGGGWDSSGGGWDGGGGGDTGGGW
jgi:hypothetical protein